MLRRDRIFKKNGRDIYCPFDEELTPDEKEISTM